MPEKTSVDLNEYVGRPVAEAREALAERGIRVETQPDAITGPLSLLVAPARAEPVPPESRVVAYTARDRITRFVVDEVGSLRGAAESQAARLESLEARVAALEEAVARLSRGRGAEQPPAAGRGSTRRRARPE
jgi:hypothetical protein